MNTTIYFPQKLKTEFMTAMHGIDKVAISQLS